MPVPGALGQCQHTCMRHYGNTVPILLRVVRIAIPLLAELREQFLSGLHRQTISLLRCLYPLDRSEAVRRKHTEAGRREMTVEKLQEISGSLLIYMGDQRTAPNQVKLVRQRQLGEVM